MSYSANYLFAFGGIGFGVEYGNSVFGYGNDILIAEKCNTNYSWVIRIMYLREWNGEVKRQIYICEKKINSRFWRLKSLTSVIDWEDL